MPSLRFTLPNSDPVTHVLTHERITIGRRPENTIQIVDRSVSGHHAELRYLDGHYCLHDLKSTNLTCIDAQPVTDFHLHTSCRVSFGHVECAFDAEPNAEPEAHPLTAAQLERDAAFLRGENSELLGKLDFLQRRLDILGSARLVTNRSDTSPLQASSEALKAMTEERDDVRHRNVGLTLELERVHEALAAVSAERDQLRQTLDRMRPAQPGAAGEHDANSGTQRIELPEPGVAARKITARRTRVARKPRSPCADCAPFQLQAAT